MSGIKFESPIDLEEGDSLEVEIDAEGNERVWVIHADGTKERIRAPSSEHPLFTSDVKATFLIRRD